MVQPLPCRHSQRNSPTFVGPPQVPDGLLTNSVLLLFILSQAPMRAIPGVICTTCAICCCQVDLSKRTPLDDMRRPLKRRDSVQVIQVVVLPAAHLKRSRQSILNLNCNSAITPRFPGAARLLVYLRCQLSKFSDLGMYQALPAGCLLGPLTCKVAQ